ncbi:hypothetical protein CI102_9907 [Trichoderma harzianum]|uniref:Uncharacterized protein n=1 Tax=Trichoderma harzianum CBS 226.95 TaxID=983964 RepID=A0A2T4A3L0_TRIHA|nr:hypothetical protein M431DRAFT_222250 [Trichoderma harzianum CBS 226.95]PKK46585.1 hypothetical protein CI102_9907 [Trichoderma harzianum]PTB51563.1 hypothetical protein M431DRAFT_222250 [Trichoderma harzianum CBS 226.95]
MSSEDARTKTRKDEKRQQNWSPPACVPSVPVIIEGVRKETRLLPVRLPEMQPTLMRRARDASRRLVLHLHCPVGAAPLAGPQRERERDAASGQGYVSRAAAFCFRSKREDRTKKPFAEPPCIVFALGIVVGKLGSIIPC